MSSQCANCMVYKWPSKDVPLLRCSNCKFLSYCSPECQREHWKKVHKKQCKTLAGKVEVPISTHLPESCPGCNEEKDLGTETINSQDCPAWGCLLEPNTNMCLKFRGEFPSAIESREMSRKFPLRSEHTVFVMQQIVNKLMRTNSMLSQECRSMFIGLADFLSEKRVTIAEIYHITPIEYTETSSGYNWDWYFDFQKLGVPIISNVRSTIGSTAGDPFLGWETLNLLAGFLCDSELNNQFHVYFDRLEMRKDIPREVEELFNELGTSAQFEKTWDSVLGALETELVHHSNIIDILCGGNRAQACAQCQATVIIERVFVPATAMEDCLITKPFVTFRKRIFSCQTIDCQFINREKETEFVLKVNFVMKLMIASGGLEDACDYCAMLGRSMHRCSMCKTKVYCSQECQLKDWEEVHEKICNKGDVARKMKRGKPERRSVSKKQVDVLTAEFCEGCPPPLQQWFLDTAKKIK